MHRLLMPAFAAATLSPLPLLALGATLGGGWIVAALLYLTLIAFALDQLVGLVTPDAPEGAEFPAADPLSSALALAHFAALPLAVWAVGGASGLNWAERAAAFLAFGVFFGQISNPNAHELIHRSRRGLFQLGRWVYVSLLFGHHTSAHRLVHHRWAATPEDPNSAPLGMSFYRFAPRAWIGSFDAGRRAEDARLKSAGIPLSHHPYLVYLGGALGFALAALALFGPGGLAAYLGLCAYAQAQLLLSDYVQHYGLSRRKTPEGRYEPVQLRHSWNAPHWFSSFMMLNAPRHSDHHAHPARPYPALRLPHERAAPMLPYSLPAMAVLALWPGRWRRAMDKRALAWAEA